MAWTCGVTGSSGYSAPREHFSLPPVPTHESVAGRSNSDQTEAAHNAFCSWLPFLGCVGTLSQSQAGTVVVLRSPVLQLDTKRMQPVASRKWC
jgi:hypothetical protein